SFPLTVYQSFDDQNRAVTSWWDNSVASQDLVDAYTANFKISGSVHAKDTLTKGSLNTLSWSSCQVT
ncbi:MAG TPA: hypothetical protein VLU25_12115, partial [Acidobacteriota bacterium]|nr:hypothetical protein [Acidobacteriota bacterium]